MQWHLKLQAQFSTVNERQLSRNEADILRQGLNLADGHITINWNKKSTKLPNSAKLVLAKISSLHVNNNNNRRQERKPNARKRDNFEQKIIIFTINIIGKKYEEIGNENEYLTIRKQ